MNGFVTCFMYYSHPQCDHQIVDFIIQILQRCSTSEWTMKDEAVFSNELLTDRKRQYNHKANEWRLLEDVSSLQCMVRFTYNSRNLAFHLVKETIYKLLKKKKLTCFNMLEPFCLLGFATIHRYGLLPFKSNTHPRMSNIFDLHKI